MNRKTFFLLSPILSLFLIITMESCFKNSATGRSSRDLVDDGTINSLSTPQYDQTRINSLREMAPKAMQYYKKS